MADEETHINTHRQEQAEAAFVDAVALLQKHSDNFVLYVRTGIGAYARHVNGLTQVERIAIASGVLADLNLIVSDVALVAAKQVDNMDADEARDRD